MTFQGFPEKDSLKSKTGFNFFLLTFSFEGQALTGVFKEKVKNYNYGKNENRFYRVRKNGEGIA